MSAAINQEKITYWHALALSFLLCLLQAPVFAGDMWNELFGEQLEAAESGEADAQYAVGIMYLKGQGVEQNRAKAIHWLKNASASGHDKAASKLRRMDAQQDKFKKLEKKAAFGDADAQYEIAMMYLKGLGIEQNGVRARKWLSWAAERNHDKAITRLGILSYKGEGGAEDHAAALGLFKRVRNNNVLAQYYLGEMYANGKGVAKNYRTAISWYKKAERGGFARARGKIINMEEELEMEERRKVKLAKASPPETPEPAATPKQGQETNKTENKAPEKKEAKLSALEELAAAQWLRGGKPVDYLPSTVTRCEEGKKSGLVCFSQVLQRTSGNKTIEYRVKSVIESKQDVTLIRYRNLVLNVVDLQASDDDELLGGYDDEVEGAEKSKQGFHVQTGWTPEHRVECQAKSGKGLDCMKDKTHKISLVESNPAFQKRELAQGIEEDY